jgi:type IV pilus biogenesis protein CpaD/CtpE
VGVDNCANGLRCSYSRVLGLFEQVSDPRDLIGPEKQEIRGYLSK